MAVNTDNLDEVLEQLAKLERSVEMDVIRDARRQFKGIFTRMKTKVKKVTPKSSGTLRKSVGVKSQSRRGRTTIKLVWNIKKKKEQQAEEPKESKAKKEPLINYSGVVNFKKDQDGERFASDFWEQQKNKLDQEGSQVAQSSLEKILKQNGVKVKK